MGRAATSEGGGGGGQPPLGLGPVEVQAAAPSLRRSEVFHVVKELLGFVLYMHHQIPSVLQNLENEFAGLKEEMTEMALPSAELKPSDQRKYNRRKRQVRQRIKKQEKLMNGLSSLCSALQKALDEVPSIEGVLLIIGGSLVRPLFVYDITISHGRFDAGSANEHGISKLAQSVSRKAIRALISSGAGSLSYTGPTKLFVLVRCPFTLNLPLDFLPKRDFRYSKKVIPLHMCITCNAAGVEMDNQQITSIIDASSCSSESSISDVIWFQCKHTVRGLPCKSLEE
ncbi:uncharacterized protein LOC102710979 [Oryza brachyantha]|uniref:Uncharacterized protein n=1 Tax=Oryza brachyantha TaxID=4533 RepID=J3M5C2_ORYBR|nr:uncharacterized protein LOC102710979 [Oryza brachyantha]